MKNLTKEQAEVLVMFLDAFDLIVTGYWPQIEEHMKKNGIADPETALEEAREALI